MRFVLALVLAVLGTLSMAAQGNPAEERWSTARINALWPGRKYDVVLRADQGASRHCRLKSADDNGVVCKKQHGQAETNYSRESILRIVELPTHSERNAHIALFAASGVM